MESFKASAQYDDWEGTVAADNGLNSLRKYLEDEGKVTEDESLVAASLWLHENSDPRLRAFVFRKDGNFKSTKDALSAIKGPIPVREISVSFTLDEFLGRFKIFNLILTWRTLKLKEQNYFIIDDQFADAG